MAFEFGAFDGLTKVIVAPDATPEIENALISINATVTYIRLFNGITTDQS